MRGSDLSASMRARMLTEEERDALRYVKRYAGANRWKKALLRAWEQASIPPWMKDVRAPNTEEGERRGEILYRLRSKLGPSGLDKVRL